MGIAYIQESSLTAIANAIRLKNGSSDTYTPVEMAEAIGNLSIGGGSNGNSTEIVLQSKSITPTSSIQEVVADAGFNGLSKVTVNPIPNNYGLVIYNGTSIKIM